MYRKQRLKEVITYIGNSELLAPNVLDARAFDDLLVVILNSQVSPRFAAQLLAKVWSGPIETCCARSVMPDVAGPYCHSVKI